MTRATRLLIGIITPPVFGATLLIFTELVFEFDQKQNTIEQIADVFRFFPWVVLIGFVAVGIQSLISALLIEFYVLPKKVTRIHFVRTCMLLGSLSGQIPGFFLEMMERLLPIGAVVGVILGLMLYPDGKPANEGRT